MVLDTPVFELRCHIYQGRALLPADDSGMSDPFVRVLFAGCAVQTAVKKQTLNPLWDECLILPVVKLYGDPESVKKSPPSIIVQVYDQDPKVSFLVGLKGMRIINRLQSPPEFLGQFECRASVKLAQDRYAKPLFPPTLNWLPVYNRNRRVGEILSAFELIQARILLFLYPV